MSDVLRTNRKANDADIIQLNNCGFSLATIAKILGCHPTTVTLRLQNLGIPPADTRRTFMEDVFRSLSENQQEWLSSQLTTERPIKVYVKQLLIKEINKGMKS